MCLRSEDRVRKGADKLRMAMTAKQQGRLDGFFGAPAKSSDGTEPVNPAKLKRKADEEAAEAEKKAAKKSKAKEKKASKASGEGSTSSKKASSSKAKAKK